MGFNINCVYQIGRWVNALFGKRNLWSTPLAINGFVLKWRWPNMVLTMNSVDQIWPWPNKASSLYLTHDDSALSNLARGLGGSLSKILVVFRCMSRVRADRGICHLSGRHLVRHLSSRDSIRHLVHLSSGGMKKGRCNDGNKKKAQRVVSGDKSSRCIDIISTTLMTLKHRFHYGIWLPNMFAK